MLKVPDELDLLVFFESDPVDRMPEEGCESPRVDRRLIFLRG